MRPLLLAASILATAVSGMAVAGQVPPAAPAPAAAPAADAVLTRADALARADQRFALIDTDHDGRISAAERTAMPQQPRGPAGDRPAAPGPEGRGGGRALERADANSDGVVTREEFAAQAGTMFDRQDLNKDGKVDEAERQKLREQRMERRGERGND